MPEMISALKIKGKLDGVSYYESNGKLMARMAKGPSKEALLTNPAYARTRENMKEFSGAASAGKLLRHSFRALPKRMRDRAFSSRLAGWLKVISKTDVTSERGQREVIMSTNKSRMEKLEFNKDAPLIGSLTTTYTASVDADRVEGTIQVIGFHPEMQVLPPFGSTHCRLVQAIGTFSDLKFDSVTNLYIPTNPLQSGVGANANSGWIPLNAPAADITLTATLPGITKLDDQTSLLQCFGIEFAQKVGAKTYPLEQASSMQIIKIW